jgi:hypothetical protein
MDMAVGFSGCPFPARAGKDGKSNHFRWFWALMACRCGDGVRIENAADAHRARQSVALTSLIFRPGTGL